ncbi:MAG: enoyl-CoA hydratase/isomerase family protein [Polyangia bacterium]
MPGALHIVIDDAVATLTLSNPTKKNALDPALLHAIVEASRTLPNEGVRALVLTAEGTLFSSGYDLDALDAGNTAAPLERTVQALLLGALPIVCALPGLAIGGGCELACACDLRVAHPGVALQMPPVRLGIVYPVEGLRRFVALIGASHTREMFLTAERVDAERALRWGLVDRVVEPEAVLPTALGLARQMAKGEPGAIRGTRQLLGKLSAPLPSDVQLELDEIVRIAFDGDEAMAARRAFRDRKLP